MENFTNDDSLQLELGLTEIPKGAVNIYRLGEGVGVGRRTFGRIIGILG